MRIKAQLVLVVFLEHRLSNLDIAVIGAGSLGSIIAKNMATFHSKTWATKRTLQDIQHLKSQGVKITDDNSSVDASVYVYTIKKHNLSQVNNEIKLYGQFLISAIAGVTLNELDFFNKVARIMPSIGVATKTGFVAYSMNSNCGKYEQKVIDYIFQGNHVFEIDESLMNLVTIGACLPGLYAKILETECDDATKQNVLHIYENYLTMNGLDYETSVHIVESVVQTIESFKLRGLEFDSIYAKVASPGGGTVKAHEYAQSIGFYNDLERHNKQDLEIEINSILDKAYNHFKGK